jgi:2'-hydroxyisoflavone reductase
MMNLLILGGTRFVGRALVDAALVAGYEVTLFNRGQSNPGLYGELEQLTGDRDGGLDALRGRRWDAVIDTCGYVPRLVGDSARLLAEAVEHYTFISSISVYRALDRPGIAETYDLATMADETVEEITGETYGPLKVLCEKQVDEVMGNGRSLHIRAGLIVGPHDPTDRFSYWVNRAARGGEMLAPGDPNRPVQFIDVRDLADWTIKATGERLSGPFNATGPAYRLSMGEMLETCRQVASVESRVTWVDEPFLLEQGVKPWSDLPLWIAGEEVEGFGTLDCRKAQSAGLVYRPLSETVADTLAWLNGRSADHEWRVGITAVWEAELLQLWRTGRG